MGIPKKDHTAIAGKRYGHLVALAPTDKRSHNGTTIWTVQCDCGTIKELPITRVTHNEAVSCGCVSRQRDTRTPPGYSGLTVLLKGYKEGAKRRGFQFSLTREEFSKIVRSPCHYCGVESSLTTKGSRGIRMEHGLFRSNGIDRVDNSVGYILSNCVSCCTMCSLAKHTRNRDDFLEWIQRVYNHNFTNS
jgi:hypothetical protein